MIVFHWFKICFRLRQELSVLEEEKDLFVCFYHFTYFDEEARLWKNLMEDLNHMNETRRKLYEMCEKTNTSKKVMVL